MATKIRIGYLSTVYHSSLLLMATGWLESCSGIEPSWELFGGGPSVASALTEGKLDLGYTGLPPVLMHIDKGARIKCVAGGHREGTILIATSEAKSLDELGGDLTATLAQFEGQNIGVPPPGSTHDIIVRDLIEQLGLAGRIKVKNYKWADLIVIAMERGEIRLAAGTPALAIAARQALGAKVIVSPRYLWPNNPSYGIVLRSEIIENSPNLVTGFLQAHRQAVALIRECPAEAAQIVAQFIGLVDKDFVFDVLSLSPLYDADITPEFAESTLAFVPVLRRLGYITHNLTANDVFDSSFSDHTYHAS